ncbi:unnamed protein product [Cladocopium goreaui]|uniref:Uncharacterized protein n=1 Tax=Cladocopium goreaui TaxID=2562237 RepID=A0A9P1GQ85_9DINO|nr:unnamed protein product [Cladocopium goreaui]
MAVCQTAAAQEYCSHVRHSMQPLQGPWLPPLMNSLTTQQLPQANMEGCRRLTLGDVETQSNDFPSATTVETLEAPLPRQVAPAPVEAPPKPRVEATQERQERRSTGFGLCPDIPRYNPDANS